MAVPWHAHSTAGSIVAQAMDQPHAERTQRRTSQPEIVSEDEGKHTRYNETHWGKHARYGARYGEKAAGRLYNYDARALGTVSRVRGATIVAPYNYD